MRPLIDLLVPPTCDGCGGRGGVPWCGTCAIAAVGARPASPCDRCAGRAGPGHPCWPRGSSVARTVAISSWRAPVREIVTSAKLAGRAETFAGLGVVLADRVVEQDVVVDLVVPVPTDRGRRRRRGLDHTAVMARALAGWLELPVVRALRTEGRQPDRGAGAGDRDGPDHRGVPRFAATAAAPAAAGRRVLLVDDVLTTGTTLSAAAAVLRAAGVSDLAVAVVARAGAHELAD